MAVQTQIQTRRGSAATWTSTNPTLAAGELGFETDTGKFKIGTGALAWTALLYAGGGQSTLTTYQYTATASQTTFSGADSNALTLAYTVGAIQVYLNGALLANTTDYAATTGTSVVLSTGASVGDSLTILSLATFQVANTYTQAQTDALFIPDAIVDAKGDLIAATAADAVSRLAVGANATVLTADSTAATGMKWAAAGGLTKIFATTFSNVANTGTTFDAMFTSTYDNYMVVFNNMRALTNSSNLLFQLRNAASTQATAYYGNSTVGSTVTSTTNATSFNIGVGFSDATQENSYTFIVYRNTNRLSWSFQGMTRNGNGGVVGGGFSDNIVSNGSDGFILSASAGNITGKATIYGLAL